MKKSYMHINFTFMRMHTNIPYLYQYIHKSTAMFELWIHIYVFMNSSERLKQQ